MNDIQAKQIATIMLQSAEYHITMIKLYPIVTRREGRESTYMAIANALSLMTGLNADKLRKAIEVSNGNKEMTFVLTEDQITRLRDEYFNAPVYQDSKGRKYIMYHGVYTQDMCYQKIYVERYIEFQQTTEHRNIEKLQKRINRNSRQYELDVLKDEGILNEMTDEEYSKIAYLYN